MFVNKDDDDDDDHDRGDYYINCGGVFEQLARYTTRYQESDLHLGLYSS